MVKDGLNLDLVEGLKAAKTKRAYFAFVIKGGNDGALIVSKTKVMPAEIAEAKKKSGGSTVVSGFCSYQDSTFIFETGKPAPATAAAAAKAIALRDAGLTIKAEFRVSSDPELADHPAHDGRPQSGATPDGADVIKRLNDMTPDIKTALAGPNKAAVQALYLAASNHIKDKDYGPVPKILDDLSGALKQAGGDDATQSHEQETDADVVKRLNALSADIKLALAGPNKDKVHELLTAAGEYIKQHEYDDAAKALGNLEPLLPKKRSQPTPLPKLSLVALAKSRFAWKTERTNAVAEIGRLEAALRVRFKGIESQKQPLAAALTRLNKLIGALGPQLDNGLDDVLNGGEDDRPALVKKVRALMDGFNTTVDDDEIMRELDGNEVLPDMLVTEPLRKALDNISVALGPITA